MPAAMMLLWEGYFLLLLPRKKIMVKMLRAKQHLSVNPSMTNLNGRAKLQLAHSSPEFAHSSLWLRVLKTEQVANLINKMRNGKMSHL